MLPRLRDISGTDTPAEKVDLFIQLLVHDLIKDLVGKGEAGASPLKTCCAVLLRVFEDEVALMEERGIWSLRPVSEGWEKAEQLSFG